MRPTWPTLPRNVVRVVESRSSTVRDARGTFIHLDIEPEPDCLLETSAETIDVLRTVAAARWRYRCWRGARTAAADEAPARVARARRSLLRLLPLRCRVRGSRRRARAAAPRRHRDRPRATQLGASTSPFPRPRRSATRIVERLRPFADSTYLHQVIERRGRHAPSLSGSGRGARARRRRSRTREWRIHFHVPLFAGDYDGLGLDAGLRPARCSSWPLRDAVHDAPRDRDLHVGRAAGRAQDRPAASRSAASTSGCCRTSSTPSAPARR